MELKKVVDETAEYEAIVTGNGFKKTGSGLTAWTHRYRLNDVKIDIGRYGWTVYNVADLPIGVGEEASSLKAFMEGEDKVWLQAK